MVNEKEGNDGKRSITKKRSETDHEGGAKGKRNGGEGGHQEKALARVERPVLEKH